MIVTALAGFVVLSTVLMVWQWIAGFCFPLDARTPVSAELPCVSALKPLKGADPGVSEALASWIAQDFPGSFEVIFGVESNEDPAALMVRDLLTAHPGSRARLLVCPENLGANRKVSNLIQMARAARGEILVVSDADVLAAPDLVAQLVQPFTDPTIGLVHCLYRMAQAPTSATRWEAFVVNADFWSQVLQNQTLSPLRYALGAAMALRRADLEMLGGFEAVANVLADDNHLGRMMVAAGKRTMLCPVIVDCRVAPMGWWETWRHQLRWAVTIRACQRIPYFLSILSNGTLWPLLWFAATHSPGTTTAAALLMSLRVVHGLSLEAHYTRRPPAWSQWWLVPLKDLLQVVLWACAFFKRHITWRGHRFRVLRNGRLRPVPNAR